MSDKKLLGIDIGSYRLKIVESDGGRIRKEIGRASCRERV